MAAAVDAPPAIRRARGADAAALTDLALRSKALWGYDAAFMAACRAELALTAEEVERHPTYLIEGPHGPLGHYQLRRRGDGAEIHHFFVAPEVARAGLGRRLWCHLEDTAAAAARLEVDSDPHAVGFYRAMGMVRAGDAPSGSIPGRFLPHLIKPL